MRRAFVIALVAAFAATTIGARAQAVTPLDFSPGPAADARLGVAFATIAELADTPELLARPSSQSFVDDAFADALEVSSDPLMRARGGKSRDALRVTDPTTFDRDAGYAAVAATVRDLLVALGADRAAYVSLGLLAEQTAYNARVLRDETSDTRDRAQIGRDGVADGSVAGLGPLRARLAGLTAGQWTASADAAESIVAALVGSDDATPFPTSPAVWIVLLRTRATNVDARRRARHYWIDIVHYDGRRQTIGAYPNGGLSFDRDAAHLDCAIDRELDVPSRKTIPIVPGPGTTSGQLADALLRACAKRETAHAYHVRDADDDKFIADLLYRSGVPVAALLREAAR